MIAPAILWCIDAKLGLRLGLFLMINGMVNSTFKVAFHGPRLIGIPVILSIRQC
jgi:hypothetical protein